jgi:hypothetical protein
MIKHGNHRVELHLNVLAHGGIIELTGSLINIAFIIGIIYGIVDDNQV